MKTVATYHSKAFCGTYSKDGNYFLSACQGEWSHFVKLSFSVTSSGFRWVVLHHVILWTNSGGYYTLSPECEELFPWVIISVFLWGSEHIHTVTARCLPSALVSHFFSNAALWYISYTNTKHNITSIFFLHILIDELSIYLGVFGRVILCETLSFV